MVHTHPYEYSLKENIIKSIHSHELWRITKVKLFEIEIIASIC